MLPNDINTFQNYTFEILTPEGKARIIIVESSPSKIGEIFFIIGKAGSTLNAFCYALSRMVMRSLELGQDLSDVLVDLSNITSDRATYDKEGNAIRSGPQALYIALFRYRSLIKDSVKKKVEYAEDYRPSKWG